MYCKTWFVALLLNGCSAVPTKVLISNYKVLTTDSVQTKFDTIKLGIVNQGEVLSGTFILTNNGVKPIVITNTVTGCGCTTLQYDTAPIVAGDSREMNFTFDTANRIGWQLKSIDVITSDSRCSRIFIEAEIKFKN